MPRNWSQWVKIARVKAEWSQDDLCEACSHEYLSKSSWRFLVWAVEGGLVEPIGKVAAILEKVLADDPTPKHA